MTLTQSISHCVEKPPWRVNVPGLGRTVEMGDIVHGIVGGVAVVALFLPAVLLVGAGVLAFAAPVGAAAGFGVRRWSPSGIGWRAFFSAFLTYHIRRKQRSPAVGGAPGGAGARGGVVYLSLFAPPPLFVKFVPEQRKILTPKHVPVGAGYEPRPD